MSPRTALATTCFLVLATHAGAAASLTLDEMRQQTARVAERYLEIWSSNDEAAVGGVPYVYGPRVRFYGKVYSQAQLIAEKRRAIRQWPVRRYVHRPGTMKVECVAETAKCVAVSVMDFSVANPARGTGKRGSARFELGISYGGPKPVITYENGSLNRRRAS